MTKTKIALAAALFAATSSAAFAQGFDPNMANRYPGYAAPGAYGYVAGANVPTLMHSGSHNSLHSAPVRLQNRDVALPANTGISTGQSSTGQSEFDIDRFDRASSPYAGGGY